MKLAGSVLFAAVAAVGGVGGVEKAAAALASTPAKFEAALRRAKEWTERNTPAGRPRLVTVNSWNEWTEGSYLEPDTVNGFGYLEAIRRVFQASR